MERVSDLRPGRACSSSLGLPPAPGKGTLDPVLSHGMFAGELEVLGEDEANLTFSHPILVLPSHEAPLPHSLPREAARGENRLRCHSLQDQRNHHSLWRIMQGLGSPVTPVTLGCSGILARAWHALRRGARGGQFPAHQAQRTPLPRAVTRLQVEHPCKPGHSSLSYKFTHDSTSLRQPAENGTDKKKGVCMVWTIS